MTSAIVIDARSSLVMVPTPVASEMLTFLPPASRLESVTSNVSSASTKSSSETATESVCVSPSVPAKFKVPDPEV